MARTRRATQRTGGARRRLRLQRRRGRKATPRGLDSTSQRGEQRREDRQGRTASQRSRRKAQLRKLRTTNKPRPTGAQRLRPTRGRPPQQADTGARQRALASLGVDEAGLQDFRTQTVQRVNQMDQAQGRRPSFTEATSPQDIGRLLARGQDRAGQPVQRQPVAGGLPPQAGGAPQPQPQPPAQVPAPAPAPEAVSLDQTGAVTTGTPVPQVKQGVGGTVGLPPQGAILMDQGVPQPLVGAPAEATGVQAAPVTREAQYLDAQRRGQILLDPRSGGIISTDPAGGRGFIGPDQTQPVAGERIPPVAGVIGLDPAVAQQPAPVDDRMQIDPNSGAVVAVPEATSAAAQVQPAQPLQPTVAQPVDPASGGVVAAAPAVAAPAATPQAAPAAAASAVQPQPAAALQTNAPPGLRRKRLPAAPVPQ